MSLVLNHPKIANEIRSYVETAVGEIASDMLSDGGGFLDEAWEKRIKAAKRKKVRDLSGWLADELFNDPDTLSDLMGDRICDFVRGNDDDYNRVLDALSANSFPAMKKACESLRRKPKPPTGAGLPNFAPTSPSWFG